MKRFGWAATALLVLNATTMPALGAETKVEASPAESSPAASASPSPAAAAAVNETGEFISVKAPFDPAAEGKLNDLLAKGEKALKAAKDKGKSATYEETFLEWDSLCGDIDVIGSFGSWEFNTSPDAAVRDRSEKTEELVGKINARLYTLRMPYEVLKAAYDRAEKSLEWHRKSYAMDVLRAFEQNGVHLEGAAKERVKAIDAELIEIGTRFGKVLKDRNVLVPVTDEQAKHLDRDSVKPDPAGKKMFTLREDSYLDVMRRHPDREFRRMCYSKFFEGTLDQTPELDKMRKLREEKSKLVKNVSYATLELEDEGFTQAEVRTTLTELKTRTEARFAETMKDYLELNGGVPPKSYDLAFLEERAPTKGVDPKVLLEYFSSENVVTALFALSKKLYGLSFEKKATDAKFRIDTYDVKDRNGKNIGTVTLDLFPRNNKYSHAACWTMCGRASHYPERKAAIGLAANLREKDLEGGGKGILLDEAETLFHEFGHVLHGLLIYTEAIGGHGCPRSLVEVPSQVFESWVLDPAVLDEMAVHYKTKKPLPPELRDVLYRKSLRFAARHLRTQTLYALFDLEFHEKTAEAPQAIWDRLAADLYGKDFYPEGVPWFTRFGHLDGYGAKYWGYKFADLGKSQIYWNLVHRFRDLQSGEVGRQLEDKLLVFGGLKKLPQVAPEFTGVRLTALPYVLETLVDYPTLRAKIASEAAAGKDYKAALEGAFAELVEKKGAGPSPAPSATPKRGKKKGR